MDVPAPRRAGEGDLGAVPVGGVECARGGLEDACAEPLTLSQAAGVAGSLTQETTSERFAPVTGGYAVQDY